MTKQSNQTGFTIVEMLIATTVFGLLLLGMTAAIVQISRMFYKGVILAQTQDVSRTVIDSVSRPIQFSSQMVTPVRIIPGSLSTPTIGVQCVGELRYTFALNAVVTDDPSPSYATDHKYPHALWQDPRPADCTVPANLVSPGPNGKELIGQNMRLTSFKIEQLTSAEKMYEIRVGVIYGEDDLMIMDPDGNGDGVPDAFRCINSAAGSQWCALSELSSFVTKRI